jgi:hypothetical protein
MPRRRSRSNSQSPSKSPIRAPPPSYNPAPTIQNRTTSIANVVAEGFAWGTGISLAKNIFDKGEKETVINNDHKEKTEINVDKQNLWAKYNECMEKSNHDSKRCNDMLVEEIN